MTVHEDTLTQAVAVAPTFPSVGASTALAQPVSATATPAYSYMTYATLADSTTLTDAITEHKGVVMSELIQLSLAQIDQATYHLTATETAQLTAALIAGIPVELSQAMTVTPALTALRGLAILEALDLTDTMLPAALFQLAVSEDIEMDAALLRFLGADLSEALTLTATMAAVRAALATLADTIEITPDTTPRLLLAVTLADTVDVTPDVALSMVFSSEIVEGIDIDIAYLSPGDGVTTWAVNASNGAVTEYQNYDFNSFMRTSEGRYLASSATGLYELLGDDDQGTAINIRVKGGFLQFGGTKLSRLKAAYVAMRGAGEVVLKIVDGDDVSYIYTVDTRSMRSTKVHMGKGQRSRYFSYELTTTGGQDFDLDSLEFVPIVVNRRV